MKKEDIKVVWEGDPCPPEYLEQMMKELEGIAEKLKIPEDLLFHTVILTDDYEGPSIIIFSKEGSDCFFCEYEEVTKWTNLQSNTPF